MQDSIFELKKKNYYFRRFAELLIRIECLFLSTVIDVATGELVGVINTSHLVPVVAARTRSASVVFGIINLKT